MIDFLKLGKLWEEWVLIRWPYRTSCPQAIAYPTVDDIRSFLAYCESQQKLDTKDCVENKEEN